MFNGNANKGLNKMTIAIVFLVTFALKAAIIAKLA
jgi:hypothetical protein